MSISQFLARHRAGVLRPIAGAAVLSASLFVSAESSAMVIVEDSIDASPVALGQWFQNGTTPGGSASIVDLTGAGGNLENNAPLPNGAARLTTGFDNSHKAEIGVGDNYGTAGGILNNSFSLSYSFYKENVPGGNAFAAPAIKLAFFNQATADAGNDGFVTLVYEPYFNGNSPVTTGIWTDVQIDINNGLFWATGGFGQPNTQETRLTLGTWLTTFDADFQDANMTVLSVGVGSFNQGQEGYVDNVRLAYQTAGTPGFDKTYNFEAATAVPEPGTLGMLGLGLLAFGLVRARGLRAAK